MFVYYFIYPLSQLFFFFFTFFQLLSLAVCIIFMFEVMLDNDVDIGVDVGIYCLMLCLGPSWNVSSGCTAGTSIETNWKFTVSAEEFWNFTPS